LRRKFLRGVLAKPRRKTVWQLDCWPKQRRNYHMLHYSLIFLVLALVAGILGFGGIAGAAAGIAKILFVVFLVMFVAGLISGRKSLV
jgi:uncharacterized membrane protein YtjA (UPF0391 family)